MRPVIETVGSPLAAPSANLFGRLSPTSAEHVVEQLEGRIPYVLDGGPCEVGVESTIVGFLPDGVYLLRPGGLPTELIERMIGPLKRPPSLGTATEGGQSAPGQLPQHYAPVTPIVVIDGWHQLLPGDGVLTLNGAPEGHGGPVIQLSAKGNLKEAASRFFEALHELDRAGVPRIAAVRFPEQGLGLALNDRLLRAAATHLK
jgi:L-threonylcarbamoyladenylate synthase